LRTQRDSPQAHYDTAGCHFRLAVFRCSLSLAPGAPPDGRVALRAPPQFHIVPFYRQCDCAAKRNTPTPLRAEYALNESVPESQQRAFDRDTSR
jgi:hypothetical protein